MPSKNRSYRDSHQSESYGKNYQDHYTGDNYNTRVWELEKITLDRLLKKYLGDRKDTGYLDFACGTGRVCSFLENKVGKCVGADVSESMLKIARERCVKTEFINCDLTQKNCFGDKKFDLITAFRFFLNAENELRKSALEALRPLLKSDGFLIFNIHGNKRSFRHLQILLSGKGNEISPNEIRKLFKEKGFVIEEIVGVSFLYELFSFLPRSWWFSLEKMFQKVSFLNEMAVDFIVVAKIDEKA